MNTILKKAFRDLREHPKRYSLVVVALLVGIWGVGSILVSYYILSRDLSQNFLDTRPAHAVLESSDFAKLNLNALRLRPEIETAEFRDFSIHRIEVAPDQWIPLWLYGVSDFKDMRMANVTLEEGHVAPGSVLVERDGLRISNFASEKKPRVRFAEGVKRVSISGIVFDPAQAPATQDHFIYAYTDQQNYAHLTGEPINQRLILRFENVVDKTHVARAVDALIGELATLGIAVTKATIPEYNEHPHQWQLDTLMVLQGGISLLAFAMAAVLVSQLMASIMSRQIRQIGVLKAIGASRSRVMSMYGYMVLALGFFAAILGVPLAVLSGYGFAYFVAYTLNFNVLTTRLPWTLYAAITGISLLLPLALSLPALLKGTRVSVREALSDYGITARLQSAKTVAKWPQVLPSTFVLAVRNTLRQKKRLAVTILTMALGVAIFGTGFNVRQSLAVLLQETSDSMRHDVRVVLKQSITEEQARALFADVPNIGKMEAWNGGRGEMQTRVLSNDNGIGITALPPDTALLQPKVLQGRWLRGGDKAEMVLNSQAWKFYGHPSIGSILPLTLNGTKVELAVVGVVEEFDKAKIYMAQDFYNGAVNTGHRVNSFMFLATDKNYAKVMALKHDIERRLAATDLQVFEVMSHAERMKIIYDHLNIVLSVLLFFAFTVLLVSALGMASAMGISIMERTREIGVLRAIGATPAKVFRLFETEGLITSVASILFGVMLSWPLSALASIFFGDLMLGGAELEFVVSEQGLWITLLTTLIFGWLASRIPAQNALRVSTQKALSYE